MTEETKVEKPKPSPFKTYGDPRLDGLGDEVKKLLDAGHESVHTKLLYKDGRFFDIIIKLADPE